MIIEVNGLELAIEFTPASQGYRFWASKWDGSEWQELPHQYGVQCLLMTQFEALCGLASDLFDEAVWAEDMAEQLGIPMRFYDEEYEDA